MHRLVFVLSMTAMLTIACRKGDAPPAAASARDALMDPQSPDMRVEAPATYRARFETSIGPFVIEVTRAWAPGGADRFYNLVRHGFFDGTRFFAIAARWRTAVIPDDQVKQHNTRGMLTFATGGMNTRTTQMFINFGDNNRLDEQGFAPLGRVVEGMDVVDRIYSGYGESPDQNMIQMRGNAYLAGQFPKLDTIAHATIVSP